MAVTAKGKKLYAKGGLVGTARQVTLHSDDPGENGDNVIAALGKPAVAAASWTVADDAPITTKNSAKINITIKNSAKINMTTPAAATPDIKHVGVWNGDDFVAYTDDEITDIAPPVANQAVYIPAGAIVITL